MADKQATLDLGGQSQNFPILEGSVGPDVRLVNNLHRHIQPKIISCGAQDRAAMADEEWSQTSIFA